MEWQTFYRLLKVLYILVCIHTALLYAALSLSHAVLTLVERPSGEVWGFWIRGHSGVWTGGARDWTPDLLVTEQSWPPPELQPPIDKQTCVVWADLNLDTGHKCCKSSWHHTLTLCMKPSVQAANARHCFLCDINSLLAGWTVEGERLVPFNHTTAWSSIYQHCDHSFKMISTY